MFEWLSDNRASIAAVIIIALVVMFVASIVIGRKQAHRTAKDAVFGDPERTRGGWYWAVCGVAALMLVWFYFIPSDEFPMMVANQLLIAFTAAPMMPLFWSMIADTADYGAVKFGHRSTGIIFSAGTASQKIGWTIGPALAMLILGGVGYVANSDQSPETLHALRLLMSVIPAVFAVLTAGSYIRL